MVIRLIFRTGFPPSEEEGPPWTHNYSSFNTSRPQPPHQEKVKGQISLITIDPQFELFQQVQLMGCNHAGLHEEEFLLYWLICCIHY